MSVWLRIVCLRRGVNYVHFYALLLVLTIRMVAPPIDRKPTVTDLYPLIIRYTHSVYGTFASEIHEFRG